jgi:uncharacterized protein (DUF927 family)
MTLKENEIAEKLATDSLERHEKDLLKDIFHQYNIAFSSNNPSQIHRTLAYFSALLIKLSRQAEKSTKRIIHLTYTMLFVSVVLLFITAWQLITALQTTKKPIIVYLKPNEPNNQTDQKENTKTIHDNNNTNTAIQSNKVINEGQVQKK